MIWSALTAVIDLLFWVLCLGCEDQEQRRIKKGKNIYYVLSTSSVEEKIGDTC